MEAEMDGRYRVAVSVGSAIVRSAMPARKNSGSRVLPELARMVKRAKEIALVRRGEGALSAEHDGENAVVLGRVGPGRTRALRLAERDRLPVEQGLDARVHHVDRETEARHGIPIGVRTDGPEVEAWIAGAGNGNSLGGGAVVAEP